MREKWHVMRKTQSLFLQMSLLTVESAYACSMKMAVLCYAQPFEQRYVYRLRNLLETTPSCHAYTNFICQ